MEFCGIQFAPLNISLKRRLQTLAAGGWFITLATGSIFGYVIALYVLLFTNYWFHVILYFIWIWLIDKDTCERGGRRLEWVRNLSWWKYMKDYFPISLKKTTEFDLDPKRNYLFCCFPHGILSTSAFSCFATNASSFNTLFPKHISHLITLKIHFMVPLFREFIYSLGMCSSNAESIKWLLEKPSGGNVAAIMVGGVAEAFHSKPKQYRVVLKNRKGFVKIALKTGSPLVPVFSFGEIDIFDQVRNPILYKFQHLVKKIFKVAPIIPVGRGFLQYSFGFVPVRKPLTSLFGPPIDVNRIEEPTQEDIDKLHKQFMTELVKVFEDNKHEHISNADNVHLEIL